MRKRIVNWIKGQLRQAGAGGIVMGLSGGVDSGVVAALVKEAVGKDNLLALILPCHSAKEDLEDAVFVAGKLGIRTKRVDLTDIYDRLIKLMPKGNKLSRANLKPRLRMSVLYYFANNLNYLVCGTGNKSEFMVGYFSKHGDGATDILPLGDLLKKDVRRLAYELEIPLHIIIKPPSAGLWPSQTDEGEMGITYPELDDILERLAAKKRQISTPAKVAKVKNMIQRSEHKRQGPRVCYVK